MDALNNAHTLASDTSNTEQRLNVLITQASLEAFLRLILTSIS